MQHSSFRYEGVTIRVGSRSPSDLQWLEEFLYPWFELSTSAPDICVEYQVDPDKFREFQTHGYPGEPVDAFMMDTQIIRYPQWIVSGQPCLLFDEKLALFIQIEEHRIMIIAGQKDPVSRLQIMRVVRELAMGVAQARGGRFLHASALTLRDKAIIVIGRRGAGKTSMLSYLLSHLDADLLTNDRLLLRLQGNEVSFRGMPTVISIRDGKNAAIERRLNGY